MKFSYTIIFIFSILISTSFTTKVISQNLESCNICVADMNIIFQQSDAEKEAKSKLKLKQQEMETTLDTIKAEIDKLSESLKRESIVINKKAEAERERNIRIKVNDLKSLKIKFQEELDELQKKLVSDIEKEIIEIISDISKKEGYIMVVNKSMVLYSNNSTDITNKIIEKYNSEYTKKIKK